MANKSNSFISGFSGGMGAMTNLINAREQRDYNAQRMEWMKEDRAFQEKEIRRTDNLKSANQWMHYYRSNKEQRQSMEQSLYDGINADPKWKTALNNGNPDEEVRFNNFKVHRDKDGKQLGLTPVLDVYSKGKDGKDGKLLRTDDLTQFRENGGQPMYIPTKDAIEWFSSGDMESARIASEMKVIGLGGDPGERYRAEERFGMQGEVNERTNKFTPYTTKKGSKNSSSGSDDSWEKLREYKTIDLSDPDNPINIHRRVERMGDSEFFRYLDSNENGKFKYQYFTADTPGSLEEVLGGGGGGGGNPDPTPNPGEDNPDPTLDNNKPKTEKDTSSDNLGVIDPNSEYDQKYRDAVKKIMDSSRTNKGIMITDDIRQQVEQQKEAFKQRKLKQSDFQKNKQGMFERGWNNFRPWGVQ